MFLTFVSILAASSPAPVAKQAHVQVTGMVCTVRPLVQGSGTVRECFTISSKVHGA